MLKQLGIWKIEKVVLLWFPEFHYNALQMVKQTLLTMHFLCHGIRAQAFFEGSLLLPVLLSLQDHEVSGPENCSERSPPAVTPF